MMPEFFLKKMCPLGLHSPKRTIDLKSIRHITVSPHRDTMVAVSATGGDTLVDLGQHSKVIRESEERGGTRNNKT